jgi:FtsZ-binding cell division protein ZapB
MTTINRLKTENALLAAEKDSLSARNAHLSQELEQAGRARKVCNEFCRSLGQHAEEMTDRAQSYGKANDSLAARIGELEQENQRLNTIVQTFRDRFIAHQTEMKMEARMWDLDIHEIIER